MKNKFLLKQPINIDFSLCELSKLETKARKIKMLTFATLVLIAWSLCFAANKNFKSRVAI